MLYEHFRTNRNLGLVHNVSDLARVEWLGDDRIEHFRNNWASVVSGLTTALPEDVLAEMLLAQMR